MATMNESGIYPVDLKVLVLPIKQEEVTSGGIVIAKAQRDKEDLGGIDAILVSCGEGVAINSEARDRICRWYGFEGFYDVAVGCSCPLCEF